MYDHRCKFCLSPFLECPHLDDRGHCIQQKRTLVDGQWVYEGGLVAPREVPDAEEAA